MRTTLIRDMLFVAMAISFRAATPVPDRLPFPSMQRLWPGHQPEKTNIMGQDVEGQPAIAIGDYELEIVQ